MPSGLGAPQARHLTLNFTLSMKGIGMRTIC